MAAINSGFQLNALDPNSLGELKRLARDQPDSPETLRAAAKQFEALFIQMTLKSMREASLSPGMFDSEQSKTYQSMLDQQLALNMAHSKNNGMSEVLFRQLGGLTGQSAQAAGALAMPTRPAAEAEAQPAFDLSKVIRQPANPAALLRQIEAAAAATGGGSAVAVQGGAQVGEGEESDDPLGAFIARLQAAEQARGGGAEGVAPTSGAGAAGGAGQTAADGVPERVRAFVNEIWPHAQAASRRTGIPAQFMVAQAALETGWGQKIIRHADGSSSHNLFNIKAGSSWDGDTVGRRVTEYAGRTAYTEQAKFRSYDSYAEAFDDYADLLANSERYAEVLGQTNAGGFARSLQQAGYATDPMYADKLTRIIGGKTLRTALIG